MGNIVSHSKIKCTLGSSVCFLKVLVLVYNIIEDILNGFKETVSWLIVERFS